jgi:hypothetical protein
MDIGERIRASIGVAPGQTRPSAASGSSTCAQQGEPQVFKGGACFKGSDLCRFWGHQADAFLRWIAAPLRAAEESSRCCFQPNDGGFCRDVFVFPWMPVACENTQTPGAGILHTVAHTRHIFFLRSTQHKRYYLNFCRATPVGQRTFWFIT